MLRAQSADRRERVLAAMQGGLDYGDVAVRLRLGESAAYN